MNCLLWQTVLCLTVRLSIKCDKEAFLLNKIAMGLAVFIISKEKKTGSLLIVTHHFNAAVFISVLTLGLLQSVQNCCSAWFSICDRNPVSH